MRADGGVHDEGCGKKWWELGCMGAGRPRGLVMATSCKNNYPNIDEM